jgi:DNA-binding MarR family transcriptional regulator
VSSNSKRKTKGPASAAEELMGLMVDLPFAFFRLREAGDRLAARAGQTTGKWGLMRSLRNEGSRTVAHLARARPVARQYVQRLADELEAEGLVEFIDNPAHKRARLLRLTAKGVKLFERLERAEAAWAASIAPRFDARQLRVARAVLARLREALATRS